MHSDTLVFFIFTVDETYYGQKEDYNDPPDTEAVIDTGMPKGLFLKLLNLPLFYFIILYSG